ncbi:hypothetical protein SASPL_130630 [Salvia splendens]|uniref:Uncharacterized protein n=1 Tax=Salvia splendens TaxID=180675 RepID=A0A8X8X7Q1_SALSN|nr:hypothetical protein SASPL_130630 [Salvia splendens]
MAEISADFGPSENQVNAFLGHSRRRKTYRTRLSWSDREEDILVVSLKDLSTHGWKSDNGFRAGYLGKLEEALRGIVPTPISKRIPTLCPR